MSHTYTETLPECNACGICCTSNLTFGTGGFVRLQKADIERLPERYRLKIVKDSDPGVDRLGTKGTAEVGYRCIALRGTPGVKTQCTMYEQRPQLCRAFERGSDACRKERANWFFRNRMSWSERRARR